MQSYADITRGETRVRSHEKLPDTKVVYKIVCFVYVPACRFPERSLFNTIMKM